MMAKGHVITGLSVTSAAGALVYHLSFSPHEPLANAARSAVHFALGSSGPGATVSIMVGVLLVVLGSLLPDIDSATSKLGRHVPFPGPHHGITHTDWALIPLVALVCVPGFSVTIFLLAGYLVHLWMDGLSRAGRVRFYPLTQHKVIRFPDGVRCVVRTGSHRGLYRVGTPAETAVVAVVTALSLLVVAVSLVSL